MTKQKTAKTAKDLLPGDKFTISGCGYSADGEFAFNGYTADGRKVDVVRLVTYELKGTRIDSAVLLPGHFGAEKHGSGQSDDGKSLSGL